MKIGNPQASPLQVRLSSRPSSMPTSDMFITPSGSLTDNANPLQRALDFIWTTIRRDLTSAVLPADRRTIRIQKAPIGPSSDQYARILYQNMAPEAREIISRGEFDPRDLLVAMPSVSATHHGLDTTFSVYAFVFHNAEHPSIDTWVTQAS